MPSPSPLLWLRPPELKAFAAGQLIGRWIDAGQYGNDCFQSLLGQSPAAIVLGDGRVVANFAQGDFIDPVSPLAFPGDLAVYVVAQFSAAIFLSPAMAVLWTTNPAVEYALQVTPGLLAYATPAVHVSAAVPTVYGNVQLYSMRRVGGSVVFRVNGVKSAAVPLSKVELITTTNASPSFPIPRGPGLSTLFELQYYSGAVSDSQDAAIAAGLIAAYNCLP